jgi:hypothetical protein
MAEDKGFNNFRVQERSAAKSASPSADYSLQEKESRAPAGIQRDKTLSSTGVEVLKIGISVANGDSAEREIERATVRSGGVVLRRDTRSGGDRILAVRLRRKAVHGYVELLKQLGDVRGTVSAAPEGDDSVEIYLTVTVGRE